MTRCHNCGHAGTFVLLAQFAVAVSGADAASAPTFQDADPTTRGDLSLSVQCPECASTDVAVRPAELLARYGSSTTS